MEGRDDPCAVWPFPETPPALPCLADSMGFVIEVIIALSSSWDAVTQCRRSLERTEMCLCHFWRLTSEDWGSSFTCLVRATLWFQHGALLLHPLEVGKAVSSCGKKWKGKLIENCMSVFIRILIWSRSPNPHLFILSRWQSLNLRGGIWFHLNHSSLYILLHSTYPRMLLRISAVIWSIFLIFQAVYLMTIGTVFAGKEGPEWIKSKTWDLVNTQSLLDGWMCISNEWMTSCSCLSPTHLLPVPKPEMMILISAAGWSSTGDSLLFLVKATRGLWQSIIKWLFSTQPS